MQVLNRTSLSGNQLFYASLQGLVVAVLDFGNATPLPEYLMHIFKRYLHCLIE